MGTWMYSQSLCIALAFWPDGSRIIKKYLLWPWIWRTFPGSGRRDKGLLNTGALYSTHNEVGKTEDCLQGHTSGSLGGGLVSPGGLIYQHCDVSLTTLCSPGDLYSEFMTRIWWAGQHRANLTFVCRSLHGLLRLAVRVTSPDLILKRSGQKGDRRLGGQRDEVGVHESKT